MLEALTGTGLATAAGLNAYIPLLAVGVLDRYTKLIDLPAGWHWLANGWVIAILAVLLAVEVVVDKVPAVDSVNDVVQTVVRPTAGGLAFGATSSAETMTVRNPGALFAGHHWVAITAGVVIALLVHGTKATARPVANTASLGMAAPLLSTAEDVASAVMSVVAIVFPILVLILIALLGYAAWRLLRRRSRGRPVTVRAARSRRGRRSPTRR